MPDLSKELKLEESSDSSIGLQQYVNIYLSVTAVLIQKSMHIDC